MLRHSSRSCSRIASDCESGLCFPAMRLCSTVPHFCSVVTEASKHAMGGHMPAQNIFDQRRETMRFNTSIKPVVLTAVLALVLPGLMWAQSATEGAISGTVTDTSNAVLANTTVTLKNLDKGYSRQTTTNAQGVYQFPLADPGNYEIVISASGFKQFAV